MYTGIYETYEYRGARTRGAHHISATVLCAYAAYSIISQYGHGPLSTSESMRSPYPCAGSAAAGSSGSSGSGGKGRGERRGGAAEPGYHGSGIGNGSGTGAGTAAVGAQWRQQQQMNGSRSRACAWRARASEAWPRDMLSFTFLIWQVWIS